MAIAGGEDPEGAVCCPFNAHDAFDASLVATKFVALICVLPSALLLALQFSVGCLPFLQNVQLYPAVVVTTAQNLVPWSLPLHFLQVTLE